jgi:8-oxo-dGTP pyrophosphatase MutT (NUDIX family)
VVALRSSGSGFEVLMVRRAAASEFMGNAYVFPGGSVDETDRGAPAAEAVRWEGDPAELPWRAAALRELWEEADVALTEPPGLPIAGVGAEVYASVVARGGRLDAHRLHALSRWITPEGLPKRYDTRFYVAEVGPGEEVASADEVEVFDDVWVDPARALERHAAGEWEVPFPTRRHLQLLASLGGVAAVVAHADGLDEIPGVLPVVEIGENGTYSVRVSGDPRFETGVQG